MLKLISGILRLMAGIAKALGFPTFIELRNKRMLRSLDMTGQGLEIGPSHRPVVPKSSGLDVKVLDYTDKKGLIAKYEALGVDTSKIEDVDFVWNGGRYVDLVGAERFDWVLSSHSIEHVPDMIGFLEDCRAILKVGGVLSLAVPDKRRTFDCLREVSSLGAVIDAHLRKDMRPTPGTFVDFVLNFSRRNGKESWSRFSLARLLQSERINGRDAVLERYRKMQNDPGYVDVHVWVFTPDSFVGIVKDLLELGFLSGWELAETPYSTNCEFLVALRRVG